LKNGQKSLESAGGTQNDLEPSKVGENKPNGGKNRRTSGAPGAELRQEEGGKWVLWKREQSGSESLSARRWHLLGFGRPDRTGCARSATAGGTPAAQWRRRQ